MGAEGTVDRKQCVISISYDEWKVKQSLKITIEKNNSKKFFYYKIGKNF